MSVGKRRGWECPSVPLFIPKGLRTKKRMMSDLKKNRNKISSLEMRVFPYAMVLPNLLIFTLFIAIPVFLGAYYSLTNWKGIGSPTFIGFANYEKIFRDTRFWKSFWATCRYTVFSLPLIMSVPLLLAVLMTKEIKLRGMFRAIYYWPSMISPIIVGLTFRFIFGDSTGVINYLLSLIGIGKVELLTNQTNALWVVIFVSIWSYSGFYMVNYISGLQSIPESYYEAATVDGANKTQQFLHVTLPLLKPTIFLVLVLGFLSLFKAYAVVISMTKGGPAGATRFVVQYVYEKAFQNLEMGYASALSILLTAILSVVTVLQFAVSKGGRVND